MPRLGNQVDADSAPTEFEIDIANYMAGEMGYSPEQVEWISTSSSNGETLLQKITADMIVAACTLTPQSKELIDLAGTYFLGGQDLGAMVAAWW